MSPFPLNYQFILLAAITNMTIGFLWYGPLFGKPWMALMGWNQKDMAKVKKGTDMNKTYGLSFLGALVTAYVLGVMINYTAASTFAQGMRTGFWLWLGFVAPVQLSDVLYGTKSLKLFSLNTGYQLVTLLVNGAILARWV